MNLDDRDFDWRWHIAINEYNTNNKPWQPWMYDAKAAWGEIKRLPLLFEMERTGKLPAIHHQCSHDVEGEAVPDNHLTCVMGIECRKCPFLLALDSAKATPEEIDQMKAWTCVTHILTEKVNGNFDTSEGYIKTTDDIMYWKRVYESMANTGDSDEDVELA